MLEMRKYESEDVTLVAPIPCEFDGGCARFAPVPVLQTPLTSLKLQNLLSREKLVC